MTNFRKMITGSIVALTIGITMAATPAAAWTHHGGAGAAIAGMVLGAAPQGHHGYGYGHGGYGQGYGGGYGHGGYGGGYGHGYGYGGGHGGYGGGYGH